MHILSTFDVLLAKAASESGSAAGRDYDLASGGDGGFSNAIWSLAAERLGVPAGQWPSQAGVTSEQMRAEEATIREEITGQWEAHLENARTRAYTGWSRHSTGPVRYAEETE